MRAKRGSGTFARRMEEALAPLLVFLFVIRPLYLSITNPSLPLTLTLLTKHPESPDFILVRPSTAALILSFCERLNPDRFLLLTLHLLLISVISPLHFPS